VRPPARGDGVTAEQPIREVPSRLLSAKKDTRLVLRRDAEGLKRGERVRSVGTFWKVDGFIHRTGDVVLSADD
jgi:hypothetical protein